MPGERSGLTDDCISGEARDRLEIGLPGRQSQLVGSVAATGTPVVPVMIAGRPLAIGADAAVSAAILRAWVLGEGGAGAVSAELFGRVNPGGKLPITVPRHLDLPCRAGVVLTGEPIVVARRSRFFTATSVE